MSEARSLVDHDELDQYERAVGAFLDGSLDADRFMAMRLQQGVYGQRQDGVHMVRVKLPAGRVSPKQLQGVAEVLEKYVRHDVVHISTRQDIQIHYVPTADTPTVLRHLAEYGLTSREACGNTVRNITACPMAGICPREHVDINPYVDAAVDRFLRHPLTQHLPRKFKISLSGCEADCAQGMMHDLAVVAVRHSDGRYGFKILAGGGLGHKPHEAIIVEPFVDPQDLLPCMEAVISLHHRYSDRKRRARARIKFLVDKFGPEGFVEKYKEELERTKGTSANQPLPDVPWTGGSEGPACGIGAPRKVLAQKQPGLFVFPIGVYIGDINAKQLRGIAALMEREGLTELRATQDQNLMIINVPEARIPAIRDALKVLDLAEPKAGDDIVACPGTSTCRLGITSSKLIADLLNGTKADLRIRASGCHNSCAQPDTADIGLYGEGRRMHGKLVPHYVLQLGGNGMAGGALAFDGPEIPAARTPQAIERIEQDYLAKREQDESFFNWSRRLGAEYFDGLLADLAKVEEKDLLEVLKDFGERDAFKVLQLGGGECMGAGQEIVSANFYEAAYERDCRNDFAVQRRYDAALQCIEAITTLVGRSLLFVAGKKADTTPLQELPDAIRASLPKRPELAEGLADILADLKQYGEEIDEAEYKEFADKVDLWTWRSARLCQLLDPQLEMSASLRGLKGDPAAAPVAVGAN